jgi:CO/xanthine dehydrogenase FAD-binding subunit
VRLTVLEEKLVGKKMEENDLATLAKPVVDKVIMITSYKSSIEYRKHILNVYLNRAYNACKSKMEEQGL